MATNKEVFETLANSVVKGLRDHFGPPDGSQHQNLTPQTAVALMQLSLLYFSQTGAPPAVVHDFFIQLMGENPNFSKHLSGSKQETKKEIPLILLPGGKRG
jgi:hypothetical protein